MLACGQAAFVVTLFVLQWFSRPGVTTLQEVKVVPYFKHFLVLVVISHLVLACLLLRRRHADAECKIVYALGVCFYPLLITYNLFFLNGLPGLWQRMLDPLAMRWGQKRGTVHTLSAEAFNRLVVTYDAELIINRAVMLLIAAGILMLVYRRFIIAEPPQKIHISFLNLSTASERISFESEINWPKQDHEVRKTPLPIVNIAGHRNSRKLKKTRRRSRD